MFTSKRHNNHRTATVARMSGMPVTTFWYGSPCHTKKLALGSDNLHNWFLRRQSTIRHGEEMSVDGETGVDQGNECRHHVADVDSF